MSSDKADKNKDTTGNEPTLVDVVEVDANMDDAAVAKDTEAGASDESTPKADHVDADQNSGSDDTKTGKPKKSKKGLLVVLLLIVVLLVCGAMFGGWYFLSQKPVEQVQQPANNTPQVVVEPKPDVTEIFEARIAELTQELDAVRRQVVQTNQQQSSVVAKVGDAQRQTESQLLSLARRITEANATESGDWILAEADYLLRIANQRLVTSQDISGAIEMMRKADNILLELAYPELTEARRQLVADITRLELIQPIDREGIYFALDALRPAISELSSSDIERLEVSESEVKDVQSIWRYWEKLKHALSPYIVVKSDAGERKYLVSDDQDALIKAQIHLDVRQAQLAMMSGREAVYQSALERAIETVELNYGTASNAQSMMKILKGYANRSVSQESLDINQSVRTLGRVLDSLSSASIGLGEG